MKLRKARRQDAIRIHQLIEQYARKGLLLPRSLDEVTAHASHFVVAERDGAIVGCAALEPYNDDLGELRSLAVDEAERGRGTGRELLRAILRRARRAGLERVFAVTHAPHFFLRGGFDRVGEVLPEKIARDCAACTRFGRCTLHTVVAHTGRLSRSDTQTVPTELPTLAT